MADKKKGNSRRYGIREGCAVSGNMTSRNMAIPFRMSSTRFDSFKAATNYYHTLSFAEKDYSNSEMFDCPALRLCRFLLAEIRSECPMQGRDCYLSESFYLKCARRIRETDLSKDMPDWDTLLIHLKQMANILQAGSVLHVRNGMITVRDGAESGTDLYHLLLTTLWDRVPWEHIFPSDPLAARNMQRNRSVMRDILLGWHHCVPVESVANEFFCRTGLSVKNDLFHISFLDFYLFSWLRNFDIIKYLPSVESAPVAIEITERGRKILSLLG